MKNSLPLFPLLFLCSLHAQSPLEKDMQNYNINYLPEKVFVHTDKDIYAGGETIWMAVYLVDGRTHRPGTFTNTVRVELHDGEGNVVARQQLRSEDGHTNGGIVLPASVLPGEYQLAAFTHYQRNSGDDLLFRKTISVFAGLKENGGIEAPADAPKAGAGKGIAEEINLRFFPEGGDCINGVFCWVAVVAEGASGQPVQVKAILQDETGAEITQLETDGTGMGSFGYQPISGKRFKAMVKGTEKTFDLPDALDDGYYLGLLHLKDDVRISLKTNRKEGLTGSRIAIHLRGIPLVDQVIENENQEVVMKLPKAELAPGVYMATIFDDKNQPVAERLFFISPKEEASGLAISTDREKYGVRQEVNLRLTMQMEGVAVDSLAKGRMSFSVLPADVAGSPSGDDIRTWLLLNSDLDRPIPNTPELIFSDDPKIREQKVDEFLMTRGWRRFRWEMTGPIDDFKPEYLLEKGVFLRGRMGKYESPDKPLAGKVVLTRPKMGYVEEVETDENGLFDFGPYVFEDTIDVVLQGKFGRGKKKEKENPYTHLEIVPYPSPKLPPAPYIGTSAVLKEENAYKELSERVLTIARNYDSLTVVLDVVDITAKRIEAKEEARKERTFMYGNSPDSRLDVTNIPTLASLSVFDLLRRIPGVQVLGIRGEERVQMRGQTSILLSSEPTYYVDGFATDLTYIRNLQADLIEFIDVIRGNRAAFLGPGGTNGAILIYTKQGADLVEEDAPGVLPTNIIGYHKARQFAVFDPNATGNQNRPDFRTTIHWNGHLRVGKTGVAEDVFTTSDQKGQFVIIAQGLRNDGLPFFGVGGYLVE